MNKICTTIEQSKKLLELGIDRKTSDMYYWCGSDLRIGGYRAQDEELDIPAWSLTALFGLMPKIGASEPKLCKRYYIYAPLIRYVGIYGLLKDTKEYDNPVDACYEIIVWLKENGKL